MSRYRFRQVFLAAVLGLGAADALAAPQYTVGRQHAFRFSDGSMLDLGTLDGFSSTAMDINGAVDVVGESGGHAFVYGDGLHDPGAPMGYSITRAINDAGAASRVPRSCMTPSAHRKARPPERPTTCVPAEGPVVAGRVQESAGRGAAVVQGRRSQGQYRFRVGAGPNAGGRAPMAPARRNAA